MIPITSVQFGPEEEAEVLDTLRSGIIAQGPKVERLERRFGELFGVEHVVAVNNGTTALVAALEVLDLAPGDEVLTSPFTFVATLNAILHVGATPRFVDIGEDFTLDPELLADAIGPATRVIMPVHLFGCPADMTRVVSAIAGRDIVIIEDAAQALGAAHGWRPVGSFGTGCFSFYATKNITTGEGGMITTDSDELADKLRILRNQGMRARYAYEMAGNNYRLTDLQAVLALPQLSRYAATVARRQENAAKLSAGLAGVRGLVTPVQLDGREHVWHQYTVRITEDARIDRDEFVAKLGEAGVGCGVYYPKLIFEYDAYRNDPRIHRSDVPVASEIVTQVASIPVHNALSDDDIATIVGTISDLLGA
jgi:perosamine synthetase